MSLISPIRTLAVAALTAAALTLAAGCATAPSDPSETDVDKADAEGEAVPPVAKQVPHELTAHGHTRIDEYYWLRERTDPEVIAYLEAENAYAEAMMRHTEKLQEEIFREIVSRIPKTDQTVPYRLDDYYYYTRYEGDGEYPIYCRKRGSLEAPEEVLLDGNELARGHDHFALRDMHVTPDHERLVFATDTVGRRFYTLRFKDLRSGELLPDALPDVTPNSAWSSDGRTLLYTRQDPETLRSYRVYRHRLGTDPAEDALVYEEDDETFFTFVSSTASKRYLLIVSAQTLATEVRYLDADDPEGELRLFEPRRRGHEYQVDHLGDHFYVHTNHEARNFRMMKTPEGSTGLASWREIVPHRDDVFLSGFTLFRDHLAVSERRDGLPRLRVLDHDGREKRELVFDEPAYHVSLDENPEPDTDRLRYVYTSLTTPKSTYEIDMETGETTLLKREEVGGGFDPADYVTERLEAPARDGARIPVSIVYRRGFERDGSRPLLLYGYGSYGNMLPPSFRPERLSLLDRGFAFAIAHVRGSQTLGREWYEAGKLLEKKNTFNDFIDAAEHLIAEGYTRPERLYANGRSAGGLLMGAIFTQRPDLFHGVYTEVPFVDVVTTMLDADIPLTTGEWDEWGDPREKVFYDYMLSYSPYDNVEARDYPHLLVMTGFHDSQVQYWEPAKWVARLRAKKTGNSRLLLRTDMKAGHSGATGRFRQHRETALAYAFLLDLAGVE